MTDDLVERVAQLRGEGISIRQIAGQLTQELGRSVSKSYVERVLKRPKDSKNEANLESQTGQDETAFEALPETEKPPAEYAGPETLIPKVSAVGLTDKAKNAISEATTLEAEWRQEQIKRAREVELLERETRALEKQARARETELKTLIAQAQLTSPAGPDEQTARRIAGLETLLETLRQEKIEAERKLDRQEFLGQLASLRQEMLGLKQVGMSQYDMIAKVGDKAIDKFEELASLVVQNWGPPPMVMSQRPQENTSTGQMTATVDEIVTATKRDHGWPLSDKEKRDLASYDAKRQATNQPTVETKAIWCPACRTQQAIPVELARAELSKGNDMAICQSCHKPTIDLKPLFGQAKITKPTEVENRGLGQRVGPGLSEKPPEYLIYE